MGDSVRTLTVLLARDMDVQDEACYLIEAIKMFAGVADVTPGTPNDLESYTARRAASNELWERVRKAMVTNVNGEWMYDFAQRR